MNRPSFEPPHILPIEVQARMIELARKQWCAQLPDGRAFFVSEEKARALLEKHGGTLFPPEGWTML